MSGGAAPQTAVLYSSINGGTSWSAVPSFPTDVTVTRIIFNPVTTTTRYVSGTGNNSLTAGVQRTDDEGITWSQKKTGMGSDYNSIYALAITPQAGSTNVLYAGTIGVAHIYKTTNSGDTWTTSYTPTDGAIINDLKVDPFSSATIYAASSKGLLKSVNSGSSWSYVTAALGNVDVRSVAVDPNTPNLVYIGTTVKFYYSTSGGSTWIDAGPDIVTAGGMAVYNDDVYMVNGVSNSLLASKLASGSSTWQVLATQTTPGFQAKDLAIDYSNSSRLYAAGVQIS